MPLTVVFTSRLGAGLLIAPFFSACCSCPIAFGRNLYRLTDSRISPSTPLAIVHTSNPLRRLIGVNYSGAVTHTFAHAYDAVGNRTVQTQTITSTLVTTYTYDAARCCKQRGARPARSICIVSRVGLTRSSPPWPGDLPDGDKQIRLLPGRTSRAPAKTDQKSRPAWLNYACQPRAWVPALTAGASALLLSDYSTRQIRC